MGSETCGACRHCLNGVTDEGGWPVVATPQYAMIVCPECGNKRCPKASDCRNACTRSNAPGQPGSVYAAPPDAGAPE